MTLSDRNASATAQESRTFIIALMDTLGDDFDMSVFVHTFVSGCVALLDVDRVGLLLTDHLGGLQFAASSGEPAELLGRFEITYGAGPSIECHRTGLPISFSSMADLAERWPDMADVGRRTRTTMLHAVPMRGRDVTIGALTLLGSHHNHPNHDALQLAGSLAEAATIGLLNQRTNRLHEDTAAQLQTALSSRILIEQAKGILAGRLRITVDEAFILLRGHARTNGLKLRSVAQEIINGGTLIGQAPDAALRRSDDRS